ncbi:MAG: DoxX family protein [Polyangiaceae bacterium]
MASSADTGTPTVTPGDGAATAKARLRLYWITTALTALAFDVPGVGNLVRAAHIAQDMAHLGYPPYFLTVLGTWKILGAIVIVAPRFPRLKEWAYAGMIFDMIFATILHTILDTILDLTGA